jgi:predicted DNA binding protein
MKYLRMTVPQEVVTPASTLTKGRLLNVQLLPDETILELALVRADADELRTAMGTSDSVDQFAHEVVDAQDGRCYVYQHCRPTERAQEFLRLLNEYRLMIMFPIYLSEEGGITIEIVGSESDVQRGFDALPREVRCRSSIERVGEYSPMAAGVASRLTERQREVLDAATTVGYYEVPRRGTADDVADAVGCASSTASEHLRKIEARILSAIARQ